MDSDDDDNVVAACTILIVVCAAIALVESMNYVNRLPTINRDDERHLYLRILYEESYTKCHEMLRMNRMTFNHLCARLETKGLKKLRFVDVKEKVVMCLLVIGHDTGNSQLKFDLIRSGHTISRYFHRVLRAILKLGVDLIKPATAKFSPAMGNDNRPWANHYFKDCVGAIDGTFIHASVPAENRPRYRNRKGDIRQNVLVSCGFNMKITYILVGWEGSAHDSMMLRAAVNDPRDPFTIPAGKFYLGDVGFANVLGFLVPYRGVRYHLKKHDGRAPTNAKELFNYRHSSLRNVIERTFGLLKKCFAHLRSYSFYSIETQTMIVMACCIIHNFILEVDPYDMGDEWVTPEEEPHKDFEEREDIAALQPSATWTGFRNHLAETMWNEYNHHP
ncbi:hypothetical protein GIB67_012400 [Kingdonia uniflora]|uniref:DDE Tnp4 domain-containing protein n=1 Tax=Kingdonia uniflora TaxID=39325 RepID=A0A7J7LLQ0_9MAGN|nr:hypothetical protein GIB67_012400 [Kingdonia uniflora]